MYLLSVTKGSEEKVSLMIAREQKGLSISEASEILDITANELVTYENNPSDIDMETAIKMAGLYRLPLSKMIFT